MRGTRMQRRSAVVYGYCGKQASWLASSAFRTCPACVFLRIGAAQTGLWRVRAVQRVTDP